MTRESWWIEGGAEGPLRRALDARGLDAVAGVMGAAATGEILSTDRNSAAVRLAGEPPLLVKWRRPRPGRGRRTWLRPSRERREAAALLRARERGIDTPTVWAVGERRRAGVLVGSCLLRPWVADATTGSVWLLGQRDAARAAALARALRSWHEAGFRHGDCYPKNVLVCLDAGLVLPIGCPAARLVKPGPHPDAARWKDLAQWTVGLELLHATEAAEAFPGAYLAAGPDLGGESAWRRAVEAPRRRILEKKAARLASRPEREPQGPPPPRALEATAAPVRRRIRPLARLGQASG